MTILKFIPESIKLDDVQQKLCAHLEFIASSLKDQTWLDRFKTSQKFAGIYLYGGVGRGKTMMMNAFFARANVRKELVHYQNFMLELHKKIHSLQASSADKVVSDVANSIAARIKLLCIDEFEVKDITDAMLIMRLFNYLQAKNVFIFLTTNTLPDNLYKDGLQRELFLPFITNVKQHFDILYLDSDTDYRFTKISEFNDRIIFPYSKANVQKIQNIKQQLLQDNATEEEIVQVFGRQVHFSKTHKDILFVNFNELIETEFGYADYVSICQRFKVIVLENIPTIGDAETDKATRFINFIDNAYFYKVLLFANIKTLPEEIYTEGRKIEEFKRTISRLNEMNSSEYLQELYKRP